MVSCDRIDKEVDGAELATEVMQRPIMTSAAELILQIGLTCRGPVVWGSRIGTQKMGVYVVGWREPVAKAPIDEEAISKWIHRLASLSVDGKRATVTSLAERLARFWLADQTVVYIGMTRQALSSRIEQYFKTPLGDRAPHAGGHWLKTLLGYDTSLVWWAETDQPERAEEQLLRAFAARVPEATRQRLFDPSVVLPFANVQTAAGQRKRHGVTGSRLKSGSEDRPVPHAPGTRTALNEKEVGKVAKDASIERVNQVLQEVACASPDGEITPVEANAILARRGILRDSDTRPGKPLRELLRAGRIEHAFQYANGRWAIRCAGRRGR